MTDVGDLGVESTLAAVIAELVTSLPDTHVGAWTRVLREVTAPDEHTAARLVAAHPGAGLGPRAIRLLSAWMATVPQPPGVAVALAIEAARTRYQQDLAAHRVEIAVSGPVSDAVPTRLTASVAINVIRTATRTLLITSYAAFGVDEIVREIEAAADRGVSIDLVLETTRDNGGMLRGGTDGRGAFRNLRFHPDIHLWQWSPSERRGIGGRRGTMHAKLIAADRTTALLGSANLTDNAYTDNLEIGAVIHDPTAVGRIVDHFAALMRSSSDLLIQLPWES